MSLEGARMSLFEFLMVLLSMIIGLGLVCVLTGVGQIVRHRATVRWDWVHACGVLAATLGLLQQWWEAWYLRDQPEWSFGAMLLMLAGPTGLFLVAYLVFPEDVSGTDFKAFMRNETRPVWWIAAATVAIAALFGPVAFGRPLWAADNLTSLLLLLAFVVLGLTRRRVIQALLVPLVLIAIAIDVVGWSGVIHQQ
jgi:hypothetical protein